jgi:hypothetical protein
VSDDDLMTVGEAQSIGLRAIYATCARCFRPDRLSLDNLPNAIRLRDVPGESKLRCTFCSGLKFAAGADWRSYCGAPMETCEAPFEPKLRRGSENAEAGRRSVARQ